MIKVSKKNEDELQFHKFAMFEIFLKDTHRLCFCTVQRCGGQCILN